MDAFAYYPQYATRIAEFLKCSADQDFDIYLLVAQGSKDRILGFSLSFYFPELQYAYLDYLASDPKRSKRGYGTAIYEYNRQLLMQAGCKGLFMDVSPDDPKDLIEKERLRANQKRMEFYERCGAFPVMGTKYESTFTSANKGFFTYLLFENYDPELPL